MLPQATESVNLYYNRGIVISPYKLKFGKQPELEIDKSLDAKVKQKTATGLKDRRKENFSKHKKTVEKGNKITKITFKLGNKVIIYWGPLKEKFCQKWWPGFWIKSIVLPAAYNSSQREKIL